MFGKLPDGEHVGKADEHEQSILHSGVRIRGEIQAAGDMRIEGELRGPLESRGDLVLGSNADVAGMLKARDVVIHGRFEGLVIADQKIRLACGARVRADIYCQALVMDDGAFFHGPCHMGKNPPDIQQAKAQALLALEPSRTAPEPPSVLQAASERSFMPHFQRSVPGIQGEREQSEAGASGLRRCEQSAEEPLAAARD